MNLCSVGAADGLGRRALRVRVAVLFGFTSPATPSRTPLPFAFVAVSYSDQLRTVSPRTHAGGVGWQDENTEPLLWEMGRWLRLLRPAAPSRPPSSEPSVSTSSSMPRYGFVPLPLILIDAIIVSGATLLASMRLMGSANWWTLWMPRGWPMSAAPTRSLFLNATLIA